MSRNIPTSPTSEFLARKMSAHPEALRRFLIEYLANAVIEDYQREQAGLPPVNPAGPRQRGSRGQERGKKSPRSGDG